MVKNIIGAFEKVDFPEFKITGVVAKIDTGAFSGAMHATNITELAGSIPKIIFHPLGAKKLKVQTTEYHKKQIRSSNGQTEQRYIIDTVIKIAGRSYPLSISLSDRKDMMKEVLIGRQFLRQHNFIVDVRRGSKYRYVGKDEK